MNFENKVKSQMATMLRAQNSTVVVDSIETAGDQDRVLSVRFHVEGEWQSPAVFNFPVAESVPLDESLSAMHDLIARNWQRAHLPPVALNLRNAQPRR